MKSKLLSILSILLLLAACSRNNKSVVENIHDEDISILDTSNMSVRVILDEGFLKEQSGTWICYKFVKDETFYDEFRLFPESYAQEFSKYAYFKLYYDTITYRDYAEDYETPPSYILSGAEVYNTPVYAYKYSRESTKLENDEGSFFTLLNPPIDSAIFIKSYQPYEYYIEKKSDKHMLSYIDAPLNETLLFRKNNFIVHNAGYFFFFKKGVKNNHHANIYGIPGDIRNFFKVTKVYQNNSLSEMIELFCTDFPHGGKEILEEKNRDIISSHNWVSEPSLKLEKSVPYGNYILTIQIEKGSIMIEYYVADYYDDLEDYPG